jgi:hypothetical protein
MIKPCAKKQIPRARLIHRPDNGSSKYLWNVGKFIPDYMAQHPRRQSSSDIYVVGKNVRFHFFFFGLSHSVHTKTSLHLFGGWRLIQIWEEGRRVMWHFSLLCATEMKQLTATYGYKLNCFWTLVLFNRMVNNWNWRRKPDTANPLLCEEENILDVGRFSLWPQELR